MHTLYEFAQQELVRWRRSPRRSGSSISVGALKYSKRADQGNQARSKVPAVLETHLGEER